MSTASIHAKVLAALGDYLKRDPQTIPAQASLRDDLGLDSMATIELLYRVEEAFDFQIPDQDLPGLRTVQDVMAYAVKRLSPATSESAPTTRKASASTPSSRSQSSAAPSAAPATKKKPAAKTKPATKSPASAAARSKKR